jgi:signal transduction histidine kinase
LYFIFGHSKTRIDVSKGSIYLTSFSFLKVVFIRFFLFDRDPELFSKILVFIFLLLTLYVLFFVEMIIPVLFVLILISFFLLLILFNDEKTPFMVAAIFTTLSIVRIFVATEFSFEAVNPLGPENVFMNLVVYWFFLLLLYIIFKGCFLMKLCQQKVFLTARRYRSIANLEYRNKLLGKISKCILHDIATPVSVISGYLKFSSNLKKKENSNDDLGLRESALGSLLYLEMILSGTRSIVKGVSNKRLFSPENSILEMLEILKSRIENSRIEVLCDFNSKKKIEGNRCAFCRIFLNLLVNSIEELECSRKGRRIIEVNTTVKDNEYLLTIRDNGRGLSKDFLKKLENGSVDLGYEEEIGIGLFFVCISVRREFKGDIKFRSVRWKYTKVELKFPL